MATDPIQAQAQWMSIASIVDMACTRLGLSVPHYFQKFLQFAKWDLLNLHLDRANEVKTVLLPVSDNFTCQLPPDAIDWTKIGVVAGQFVKTLGVNGDLSKIDRVSGTPEFSYSVSPGHLPNGIVAHEYGSGLEFLNYGGRSLYAIGGGLPHEGHFQVVKRSGYIEILLDGNVNADQIYVEYISLGLNPCGATILDPYIADYILKCILYTWEEEMNPMKTEASIARRGREKFFAHTLVSGRTNSIDVNTLLNITRKGYRLTNKA